ncbi:MAG: uroporphyrinogen decarboxylase family protein [Clostridia bacterium]|jgi:uroporphyrinogen decarboxylase
MNSMERIGAVLGGGQPDRRAFTLTLSLYGARLTGQDTADYYSDPALYAAGQRAVVDLCEPDVLFGPFALSLEAKAFGATLSHVPDSPPIVSRPALKSARDILDLNRPDVDHDANLRYLVESVQAVVADQGGTRPVAAPIASPSDLPILLMGMENWLQVLLFEPDSAAAWSALALDHFEALAAAYFKAGASFLVTPVMMVNPLLVDSTMAKRLIIPLLRRAFSRLGGPIVFHHGGNRIAKCIGTLKDLPNLAGFVVDEGDSLSAVRRCLGPDMLLLGNLSGPHCSRRSAEDVQRRVGSIMTNREGDAKFILASSGADIPFDTDPSVLAGIRRTVEAGL